MQDHLFNRDYWDMIECLQRESVEFMLVGGYAVALHGWPRMTFDIDFWIMANPQNAAAVMRALKAFGVPLMDLKEEDFDILSAISGVAYEDAVSRVVRMEVDGLSLKVIALDDLIANKRASGRPKDLVDAMTLEKMREKKNG